MVILPGNAIHAVGFCFGTKMEYPTTLKKAIFHSHRLHFSVAVKKARGMLIKKTSLLIVLS